MHLKDVISDDASLEDLEDLQRQLHALLVDKFGAAAAAAVISRSLVGLPSQDSTDSTADIEAAAAAEAAADALPASAAAAAAAAAVQQKGAAAGADAAAAAAAGLPPKGRLIHSVSVASDVSDASDASGDSAHVRWQRAVGLALHNTDPWASRRIHKLPMEVVTRYRYTASTRTWVKDDVLVKMERRPFAAGAMRECFALKKLSTFSSSVYRDWRKAPNFVAKRYKKAVERTVYFADVVLQMDAKFLGDEYTKTCPPKKVDVMQAAVLEFRDRPNKPLYCVEHMIEGDYVKYNSNSGFVATQPPPPPSSSRAPDSSNATTATTADLLLPTNGTTANYSNNNSNNDSGTSSPSGSPKKQQQQQQQQPLARQLSKQLSLSRQSSGLSEVNNIRHTPQAFSHFSYAFTQGTALCVDIQGVADLYTDPQIHTLDGQGYGDGNLGLRGMALFFRTHECNLLCSRIKLQPFERCATDVAAQGYTSSSSTRSGTVSRTAVRYGSVLGRLEAARVMEQQPGPSRSLQDLLAQLEAVPQEPSPDALIHWEVARIYAETVTLPELRPDEDPDAARLGGMFHLVQAAAKGLALAQLQLACGHLGLEPSSTQLAHLLKQAKAAGEFVPHPQLALRYTQLAAQRGIKGAAAALSHAYATGGGVGTGCLPGPLPAAAVTTLRSLLQASSDVCPSTLFGDTPDGLNPRTARPPSSTPSSTQPTGSSAAAAAAAAAAGGGAGGVGTPGSVSTPAAAAAAAAGAQHTPRNSIARLISGRGARGGSLSPGGLSSPGGCLGPDGVPVGSLFAIADKLTQAAAAAQSTARAAFDAAAEEEAKLLPGGERAVYELWADLGELLLKGGPGASPAAGIGLPGLQSMLAAAAADGSTAADAAYAADDAAASDLPMLMSRPPPAAAAAGAAAGVVGDITDEEEQCLLRPLLPAAAAAAEAFTAAAEEASAAFKGKLAQRYFERAAEAEAAAEAEEAGEGLE